MKNNLKKYLILTIGQIWFSLGLQRRSRVILCFHSISAKGDKYSVSKRRFESIVKKMNKKYSFVSLEVLLSSTSKKNLATITFDDGYKNVITAHSFLIQHSIPATVFVLSKPNLANRTELVSSEPLIDRKDIETLIKSGWTIGSHSATHPDLSRINADQLDAEVTHSKNELEQLAKGDVNYFAYPKGYHAKRIEKSVREAGYKAAFSTNPRPIKKGVNRFSYPRFVIEKKDIYGPLPYAFAEPIQLLRNLKKYE